MPRRPPRGFRPYDQAPRLVRFPRSPVVVRLLLAARGYSKGELVTLKHDAAAELIAAGLAERVAEGPAPAGQRGTFSIGPRPAQSPTGQARAVPPRAPTGPRPDGG